MIWEEVLTPISAGGIAATLLTVWMLVRRVRKGRLRGKLTLPGPACIPWLGPLPSRASFAQIN